MVALQFLHSFFRFGYINILLDLYISFVHLLDMLLLSTLIRIPWRTYSTYSHSTTARNSLLRCFVLFRPKFFKQFTILYTPSPSVHNLCVTFVISKCLPLCCGSSNSMNELWVLRRTLKIVTHFNRIVMFKRINVKFKNLLSSVTKQLTVAHTAIDQKDLLRKTFTQEFDSNNSNNNINSSATITV